MPSIQDYTIDDIGGALAINAINAQSALNNASAAFKMPAGGVIRTCTAVIKGSGGIASGAVILEGSLDPPSTLPANVGNWFQVVAPVNAVASVATPMFDLAGPCYWIRARISTVIGGGTVSVDLLLSGD
jgi:hypothetical protein